MQRHLKQTALLIGLLCFFTTVSAQYYLRGEIRDENNNPLQNVRIVLRSSGYPHASGMGGAFGITTSNKVDSLDLSLEGYEPLSIVVTTTEYQKIVMKMLPYTASIQKQYLVSFTTSLSGMITRKMFVADASFCKYIFCPSCGMVASEV